MITKELIEDAKAAGFEPHPIHGVLIVRHGDGGWVNIEERLVKFAELQRQRERQAVPDDIRRDAERYRWLRDRLAIEDIEKLHEEFWGTPQEEESVKTDNAIDSAMLAAAPSPELISPHPITEEKGK